VECRQIPPTLTALTTRAAVASNRNLFCIELTNKSTNFIAATAHNIKGDAGQKFPPEVRGPAAAANPGARLKDDAEGFGRWPLAAGEIREDLRHAVFLDGFLAERPDARPEAALVEVLV
jgi:hypothetical protein